LNAKLPIRRQVLQQHAVPAAAAARQLCCSIHAAIRIPPAA
jgi:hypothetical protein